MDPFNVNTGNWYCGMCGDNVYQMVSDKRKAEKQHYVNCIHAAKLYTTLHTIQDCTYFHTEITTAAIYIYTALSPLNSRHATQRTMTDNNANIYHDWITRTSSYACETRKDELHYLVNKSQSAEEQKRNVSRRRSDIASSVDRQISYDAALVCRKKINCRPNIASNTYTKD